jgi:hypothetical protein
MSRIVETHGDLSCGGIDAVRGEICIYEYSLLCNQTTAV